MAYATVDEVLVAYNPLKTMLGSGTTDLTTPDISSAFIPRAEAYINAFIGKKYVMPVTADPLITMLTCDIAIYKICQDRQPRIPEFVQNRWIAANSILAALRDGDMVLTGSNQAVSSGGDEFAWSSVLEQAGPVFTPIETFSTCPTSTSWPY